MPTKRLYICVSLSCANIALCKVLILKLSSITTHSVRQNKTDSRVNSVAPDETGHIDDFVKGKSQIELSLETKNTQNHEYRRLGLIECLHMQHCGYAP